MKKFIMAIAILLLMASFSMNLTNNTIKVLTDIEGTLLENNPILENNNGKTTITFEVDKTTIVSSSLIGASNEIFLVENGNSFKSKKITFDLQSVNGKVSVAFNNIFEHNESVELVSINTDYLEVDGAHQCYSNTCNGELESCKRRPRGVVIWD